MENHVENEEKIRKVYSELSTSRLIYWRLKSTYFSLASILFYCYGGYLLTHSHDIGAIFLLPFPVSFVLLEINSKKLVQKKYYKSRRKITTRPMMEKCINEYRRQEMKSALKTHGYDTTEKVHDLIETLTYSHEKTTFQKLLPFTMILILLQPIWGEFVGFRFNALLRDIPGVEAYKQSMKLSMNLLLLATVLGVFLFLVVGLFRMLLLFRINREQELCKLLRSIAHEMILEEGKSIN